MPFDERETSQQAAGDTNHVAEDKSRFAAEHPHDLCRRQSGSHQPEKLHRNRQGGERGGGGQLLAEQRIDGNQQYIAGDQQRLAQSQAPNRKRQHRNIDRIGRLI